MLFLVDFAELNAVAGREVVKSSLVARCFSNLNVLYFSMKLIELQKSHSYNGNSLDSDGVIVERTRCKFENSSK